MGKTYDISFLIKTKVFMNCTKINLLRNTSIYWLSRNAPVSWKDRCVTTPPGVALCDGSSREGVAWQTKERSIDPIPE